MNNQHQPLTNLELVQMAFRIFGGLKGIIQSCFFWVAFAIWLISMPGWTSAEWWKDTIAVLPNLLGFTLGGFAIFLGFGSDSFKEMIISENEEKAQYLSVSSTFLMVVAVQVLALLWAIGCAATWQPTPTWLASLSEVFFYGKFAFWGVGFFLYIYAISMAFQAALRIFRLSRWYHSFLVTQLPTSKNTKIND